jgi:putative transposase
MPRANRHFLPGHIWGITRRCQAFLLKSSKDKKCGLRRLSEAKKRFELWSLN